jgi:hypothetical protein
MSMMPTESDEGEKGGGKEETLFDGEGLVLQDREHILRLLFVIHFLWGVRVRGEGEGGESEEEGLSHSPPPHSG